MTNDRLLQDFDREIRDYVAHPGGPSRNWSRIRHFADILSSLAGLLGGDRLFAHAIDLLDGLIALNRDFGKPEWFLAGIEGLLAVADPIPTDVAHFHGATASRMSDLMCNPSRRETADASVDVVRQLRQLLNWYRIAGLRVEQAAGRTP